VTIRWLLCSGALGASVIHGLITIVSSLPPWAETVTRASSAGPPRIATHRGLKTSSPCIFEMGTFTQGRVTEGGADYSTSTTLLSLRTKSIAPVRLGDGRRSAESQSSSAFLFYPVAARVCLFHDLCVGVRVTWRRTKSGELTIWGKTRRPSPYSACPTQTGRAPSTGSVVWRYGDVMLIRRCCRLHHPYVHHHRPSGRMSVKPGEDSSRYRPYILPLILRLPPNSGKT
jgi:hypothetical protein